MYLVLRAKSPSGPWSSATAFSYMATLVTMKPSSPHSRSTRRAPGVADLVRSKEQLINGGSSNDSTLPSSCSSSASAAFSDPSSRSETWKVSFRLMMSEVPSRRLCSSTHVSLPNFRVSETLSLPGVSSRFQTPCSLNCWRNSGTAGWLSAASFSNAISDCRAEEREASTGGVSSLVSARKSQLRTLARAETGQGRGEGSAQRSRGSEGESPGGGGGSSERSGGSEEGSESSDRHVLFGE
jgi:hypothetical protein